MSYRRLGQVAVVATSLLCSSASATTIIAKDLAAMCNEADLVFVGTVASLESRWASPEQRTIETLVTFSVDESLFGVEEREVTLRFGGGQIGDLREEIAGVPTFSVADRAVIFARRERSVSPIVGFSQGALRVIDGTNGPVVTSAQREPLAEVHQGVLRFRTASDGPQTALPLKTFLDTVRQHLSRRQGPGS